MNRLFAAIAILVAASGQLSGATAKDEDYVRSTISFDRTFTNQQRLRGVRRFGDVIEQSQNADIPPPHRNSEEDYQEIMAGGGLRARNLQGASGYQERPAYKSQQTIVMGWQKWVLAIRCVPYSLGPSAMVFAHFIHCAFYPQSQWHGFRIPSFICLRPQERACLPDEIHSNGECLRLYDDEMLRVFLAYCSNSILFTDTHKRNDSGICPLPRQRGFVRSRGRNDIRFSIGLGRVCNIE